jgi:hypothetical protein
MRRGYLMVAAPAQDDDDALRNAARCGHTATVAELIRRRADPNAKNKVRPPPPPATYGSQFSRIAVHTGLRHRASLTACVASVWQLGAHHRGDRPQHRHRWRPGAARRGHQCEEQGAYPLIVLSALDGPPARAASACARARLDSTRPVARPHRRVGASPAARQYHSTALSIAAYNGDDATVAELVRLNADLEARTEVGIWGPLFPVCCARGCSRRPAANERHAERQFCPRHCCCEPEGERRPVADARGGACAVPGHGRSESAARRWSVERLLSPRWRCAPSAPLRCRCAARSPAVRALQAWLPVEELPEAVADFCGASVPASLDR